MRLAKKNDEILQRQTDTKNRDNTEKYPGFQGVEEISKPGTGGKDADKNAAGRGGDRDCPGDGEKGLSSRGC